MTHEKPRPFVIFKNYDYNDDDPNGPGIGFFDGPMSQYKSVDEFKKSKQKRRRKLRTLLAKYCYV